MEKIGHVWLLIRGYLARPSSRYRFSGPDPFDNGWNSHATGDAAFSTSVTESRSQSGPHAKGKPRNGRRSSLRTPKPKTESELDRNAALRRKARENMERDQRYRSEEEEEEEEEEPAERGRFQPSSNAERKNTHDGYLKSILKETKPVAYRPKPPMPAFDAMLAEIRSTRNQSQSRN
ncbi:hypothetical protein BT63DRAFT_454278 [Microthyrium microscopicum]|uniref:Uncharacterized protein n=1 Tax=Microthyrium microscopicum TaxID=703497 RepID=A0A6A6UG83_9PEZI|nr:hypothetical protein BT63DRAFT_454278 [Microthyrium microscopicum]